MRGLFNFTSSAMDQFAGGDGILSQAEFANFLGTTPDKAANIFAMADTNGDGGISQQELARFMESEDQNHDGTISQDEANKFKKTADMAHVFHIKPKETEATRSFDQQFNAFRNPPPVSSS